MNPQSYGSGSAFRIALEARLKDRAATEDIDLHLDGWVTIMNRFKGLARRLRAKHSCHSQWVPSFPPNSVIPAQAGIHVSVPGAELTTLGSIYQLTLYPSRLLRLP
jgi:hypothetical protein